MSFDQAVKKLVEAAIREYRRNSSEGAFLGAMLAVRLGEGLKDHIKDLLGRLEKKKAPGKAKKTLLDVFAYISALHAEGISLRNDKEGILKLSKTLLEKILECKSSEIKSKVLHPLGSEAAAVASNKYILTRHKEIARIAVEILNDEFGIDFDDIFIELTNTVVQSRVYGNYSSPELQTWNYVSDYFFKKEKKGLAIEITKTLHKTDKIDQFFVVKLSNYLRQCDRSDEAFNLFFNVSEYIKKERSFFNEWSIVAFELDFIGLGIYLFGISIDDDTYIKEEEYPNLKRLKQFKGIAEQFDTFNKKHNDDNLKKASQALNILRVLHNKKVNHKYTEQEIKILIEQMIAGFNKVWKYKERPLPKWVKPPECIVFEKIEEITSQFSR